MTKLVSTYRGFSIRQDPDKKFWVYRGPMKADWAPHQTARGCIVWIDEYLSP